MMRRILAWIAGWFREPGPAPGPWVQPPPTEGPPMDAPEDEPPPQPLPRAPDSAYQYGEKAGPTRSQEPPEPPPPARISGPLKGAEIVWNASVGDDPPEDPFAVLTPPPPNG